MAERAELVSHCEERRYETDVREQKAGCQKPGQVPCCRRVRRFASEIASYEEAPTLLIAASACDRQRHFAEAEV